MRTLPVYPHPPKEWPRIAPIGYASTAAGAMRLLRVHARYADDGAIPVAAKEVTFGGLAKGFVPVLINAKRLLP